MTDGHPKYPSLTLSPQQDPSLLPTEVMLASLLWHPILPLSLVPGAPPWLWGPAWPDARGASGLCEWI